MRTDSEIYADAADSRPFSNHSEYEVWAGSGRGCYDCIHDDPGTERYCPILGAALLSRWPREWSRTIHRWEIGDKSGSYEVVGECTEFDQRRDWPGDDPDDGPPPPDPEPPMHQGQIDMFGIFADQIIDEVSQIQPAARAGS